MPKMFSIWIYLTVLCFVVCVKHETKIEEFPYLVSIRRNIMEIENFTAVHVCAGVIITSFQILTTASCLHDALGNFLSQPYSLTIVAGITNLNEPAIVERYSHSVRIHRSFSLKKMKNDIGIIQLYQKLPINKKTIAIGQLQGLEIAQRTKCLVVGWGATAMKPFVKLSGNLYKNDVEINTDCTGFLFYDYNITLDSSHVCAGSSRKEIDTCFQDSGSPLVCNNLIVGIANVYNDCADSKDTGTAYVKVSKYIDFIKNSERRFSSKVYSSGNPILAIFNHVKNDLKVSFICIMIFNFIL